MLPLHGAPDLLSMSSARLCTKASTLNPDSWLAGGAARLCSLLSRGNGHVAAEASRLLARLWAPGPAFQLLPPWDSQSLRRPALAANRDAVLDEGLSKAAKGACFSAPHRYPLAGTALPQGPDTEPV